VPQSINSPTPTLINKHSNIPKTWNGKSSESTWVKKTYSSTHKNMVESAEKGSKILVESIDWINATSVMLEEKWVEIQNILVEKQIEYFKFWDEPANNTQMAMGIRMIRAFNNLTQAMKQTFTRVATNNDNITTNAIENESINHEETTKH
jgi:hypothetical protein